MFHAVSELDIKPYVALVMGVVFIIVTRWAYSDAFSLMGIKKAFIKKRKIFFGSFKKFSFNKKQFFAGIAFTYFLFLIFSFVPAITSPHVAKTDATTSPTPLHSSTRMIIDTSKAWFYDFSKQPSGAINTHIFNIENGSTKADYNNESETYTNRTDNVRVQDGALVLEAKPENKDNKAYTSGRVDTQHSFSFTYGTLEVNAKLPRGVGTWPAAWLMPADPLYKASDFPSATDQERLYTLNGEIDFLESVGYLHGQNIPAAHSYDSLAEGDQYTPGFITNPYDEFHTYGVIKTPTSIEFTIDGKVYARRDKIGDDPLNWPFNQSYYLILNLSLGGAWAGKYGIDDSSAPWQYEIKSISYNPTY